MPGKTSGLERRLKGALLKVLHSPIPFQFVFQNKKETCSSLPHTSPGLLPDRSQSQLPLEATDTGQRAETRWGGLGGASRALPLGRAPEHLLLSEPSSLSPPRLALTWVGRGPNKGWEFLTCPSPFLSGVCPGWIWAKCHFLVPKVLLFLCALRAHCLLARVEYF